MKKWVILCLCGVLTVCALTACGSGSSENGDSDTSSVNQELVDEMLDDTDSGLTESEQSVPKVYSTEATEEDVKDLINIEDVTLEAGSTKSDLLKLMTYDDDKVNYASYNVSSVDLDTPGEYTATVTLNMDKKDAADVVSLKAEDTGDADTVNLRVEFHITVE